MRATATTVGSGVLNSFVIAVTVMGIAATATLPVAGLVDNAVALATLVVLAGWVGSRAIRIPRLRIQLTAGDVFMFCGLLVAGPLAAPLIAVIGVLGATIGAERRPRPIRALFNVATVGLAASAAAWTHVALPDALPSKPAAAMISLLVATLSFVLVNTVLVALAIRLERGSSFLAVWLGFTPTATTSAFASLLAGLGLQTLFGALGAVALVTGLAASVMLRAAAETFRDRTSPTTGSAESTSSLSS